MDDTDFNAWVETAPRGAKLEYYRGFMMKFRYAHSELDHLANAAWAEYVKGRVCLVQKRHGDDDYSYIACATGCPASPPRVFKTTQQLQ